MNGYQRVNVVVRLKLDENRRNHGSDLCPFINTDQGLREGEFKGPLAHK